jgi:hypothetical protein
MATEIPIACTLSATDCRARLAEIAALSRMCFDTLSAAG